MEDPRLVLLDKMRRRNLSAVIPVFCLIAWLTPVSPLIAHPPAWPKLDTVVVLQTSMGEIHIRLFTDRAPTTVANFLQLVQSGFYDEMLFHRVVRSAVVQTGLLSMEGEVRGLDVAPIRNEASPRILNRRGTVAMARTDDPHTATTEFFINVRDNPNLDAQLFPRRKWGYAVFGEVTDGMDVVDEIAKLETRSTGPFPEFPEPPVAIYVARMETRN